MIQLNKKEEIIVSKNIFRLSLFLCVFTFVLLICCTNIVYGVENIIKVENDYYKYEKNVTQSGVTIQLSRTGAPRQRSNYESKAFSDALGYSQEEYDSLSSEYKNELKEAKSIQIQEYSVNESSQVFVSANGYLRCRFTAIDTGAKDLNGYRILIFKTDYTWLKLPVQRRKDLFAMSYDNRFLQYEMPSAYMEWDYTINSTAQEGIMQGLEMPNKNWGNLLDGEFYKSVSGNRYYITADLPNKTHYYVPWKNIRLGFSIKVIDTGSGPFEMWATYGHDQGLFAANTPSISFSYKSISISAVLSTINNYSFTTNAINV